MQTSTLRHTSWCWCQKNLCFHGKYNFPHIQELTSWTNSFFFYTFWWVNKHLQGLLPVSSLDLYTFPRAASSNTYEAGMKTNGDQFFDRIFVSICIDREWLLRYFTIEPKRTFCIYWSKFWGWVQSFTARFSWSKTYIIFTLIASFFHGISAETRINGEPGKSRA